ncbi:MAG: hypothetical protein JNL60_01625 [Bacteroidia bacterium]|nr:hypothetical protein [Bacteroidia bacterium]
MQAAELIKYIQKPQALEKTSVEQLQKLVTDFPYFQSAHMLLSIASKKWDPAAYQQSLKKTAIVSNNRSHLFNLIHAIESQESLLVSEEKIAKPVELEKQEQVKVESDILKAVEIATEPVEKTLPVKNKIPEEVLEKEIGKQVVVAFVEKEILKVPEIENPVTARENPESFGDWLTYLKKNNGQSYEQIEEQAHSEIAKKQNLKEEKAKEEVVKVQARKEKNKSIIDRIIETNPGIIRQKEEQKFYAADHKAKESLLENEHLVTETLARIYALQGSVNKAVRAYEILSLKYPQKSAYFAGLIQKLKNNQ